MGAGQAVEAERIARAIQHRQARDRSMAALAIHHARRGDLEAAQQAMGAIDGPHERGPVIAQLAAMSLLERMHGVGRDQARQAMRAAEGAPGMDAKVSMLLACAKPLLAFEYDEGEDTAVAKPFLQRVEQLVEDQTNPATAFVSALALIDLCSSVWMMPRIVAVGGIEMDRYIQGALAKLRIIKQREEREGAYGALAFAIARNNRSALEDDVLAKGDAQERIFVRMGLVEGMV